MKQTILILLLLICAFAKVISQNTPLKESTEDRDARMAWWRDATLGMFIHWGAYSVAAGEYNGKEVAGVGEWIMHHGKVPRLEYENFARQFNPVQFDANEWVRLAHEAGVKYIVITSKHHDGFCLWDSKLTEYDVVDFTPFKRDILRELTEACQRFNIKMCFYYSIMDWHHPQAFAKGYPHQKAEKPDWNAYRENYLKPQLAELIKNYQPSLFWFDGEWINEWTEEQGKDLYQYLRSLKPDLIINNRVGKGRKGMSGMNAYENAAGDFGTPEQEILKGTSDYDWESCMTMNDTWGFKKNDHKWKSSTQLIHQLIDVAAKGGNYLLNIGPKADGTIPVESKKRLREMGSWLKVNGEAIYATQSLKTFDEGDSIRFTQSKDGKTLYVIALKLDAPTITLQHPGKPKSVKLLGTKGRVKWTKENPESITLAVPKNPIGEHAWTFKVLLR